MRNRLACSALLACLMSFLFSVPARAQIHPRHAAQIRKAARDVRARVAPKKPRTVLIWNTPQHLMDEDPHKGYCIPYGAEGMRAIGEASGAFQPVASDDIAMFTPEHIRQFDAIVLNNAAGPWITPTDADLAKPALKKLGTDAQEVETVLRKSFLDFLDQGGGRVCLHFAIAANRHWPEFKGLSGATFTGHPWTEEVGVTVEEPDHPLVAAFGGKDFRTFDEIYQYGPPYERGNRFAGRQASTLGDLAARPWRPGPFRLRCVFPAGNATSTPGWWHRAIRSGRQNQTLRAVQADRTNSHGQASLPSIPRRSGSVPSPQTPK